MAEKRSRVSLFHPQRWGIKTNIVVAITLTAVLVVTIVTPILVTRANLSTRYPSYDRLNYKIRDTYQGATFFDNFDYFTGYDPTSGFVHYVDGPGSEELNLTHANPTSAVLRVDTSETNATTGRKSARVTSKNQYENGLFILDVTHTPLGCGTWSALWLSDPFNWPLNGEIDVVESVNQGISGNQVALHTIDGCNMDVKRQETGNVLQSSCLNSTNDNAGCSVQGATDSYGAEFNANGGGVYGMELRSDGIRTWLFPRSAIPPDITNGTSPDPSTWGPALADFPNTDCDIDSHFRNQSIIVDIDLCGSWAGSPSVYNALDSCPGLCTNFVASNNMAFEQAYWEFNSFKVYQASS